MKAYGYTRAESDAIESRRLAVEAWCNARPSLELAGFSSDGLSGQRGIRRATKQLQPATAIVVYQLSDLASDLTDLVKIVKGFLTCKFVVCSAGENIQLAPGSECAAVLSAMFDAHTRYVSDNRKKGMALAKADGATIGRPAGLTLADVQESLRRLLNANKGDLPSVRKVAKALTAEGKKCSIGHAAKLIKEFKAGEATLTVYVVKHDGAEYFTDDLAKIPAHVDRRNVEEREMKEREYRAIPVTAESMRFFGMGHENAESDGDGAR